MVLCSMSMERAIAISESWLSDRVLFIDEIVSLNGYQLVRRDRFNRRAALPCLSVISTKFSVLKIYELVAPSSCGCQ